MRRRRAASGCAGGTEGKRGIASRSSPVMWGRQYRCGRPHAASASAKERGARPGMPATGCSGLRPPPVARGTPPPPAGCSGLRPPLVAGGTPAPPAGCSGLRPPPVAGGTPAPPAGCRCETTARVEEDGALLLVPAPAACFGGARFEQRTGVDLAGGASLLLWDVLSAGRDRWDFVRCSSAITIRREGKPLLDEAWLLDAAHGSLRERFGRFGAIGTLLLAGPLFDGAALREAVDAQAPRAGAPLLQSASPLGADATVVRLAADRVELLLAALRAHLSPLRAFFGDDPWRLDAPHAA